MVARSAGRALSLLIAKTKAYGGMPYEYFTKLYDSLIHPILDYGASISETKEFSCVNAVQNRASHYYMGVSKYTPNGAVHGDIGWRQATPRQWISVTRQWCSTEMLSIHYFD